MTCVDVSKVWMETIKKRLKKYHNVDYKLGDIVALDIADSAYDIVVVHNVLLHVAKDEQQEKVAVLTRKLKPDGRLFIREFTRAEHDTPVGRKAVAHAWRPLFNCTIFSFAQRSQSRTRQSDQTLLCPIVVLIAPLLFVRFY